MELIYMKKVLFKGSATAMVTPFDKNNKINFDIWEKLIDFQINNQTQALVILGTTGESPTITYEERTEIISRIVKKVNKKIPVIIGTGSNSTMTALKLSKEAQKLGADGALIVTPFYNKTSQTGIIKHYNYIANKIDLPIIVYNVPSRTGLNILPETYKELSKIDSIIAVKEANGDISSIIETKFLCGDDLNIYSGNDDQTIAINSVGGIGVISVLSNILPKETQQIALGDNKNFFKYYNLAKNLFCDVNPIPIKYALNYLGINCGNCRLPLCELDKNLKNKISNLINKYQIKINLK